MLLLGHYQQRHDSLPHRGGAGLQRCSPWGRPFHGPLRKPAPALPDVQGCGEPVRANLCRTHQGCLVCILLDGAYQHAVPCPHWWARASGNRTSDVFCSSGAQRSPQQGECFSFYGQSWSKLAVEALGAGTRHNLTVLSLKSSCMGRQGSVTWLMLWTTAKLNSPEGFFRDDGKRHSTPLL